MSGQLIAADADWPVISLTYQEIGGVVRALGDKRCADGEDEPDHHNNQTVYTTQEVCCR